VDAAALEAVVVEDVAEDLAFGAEITMNPKPQAAVRPIVVSTIRRPKDSANILPMQ